MKEDNNEFENLYKKAAENFPLKADDANWQSVLSALEEDDKKTPFYFNRNFILGLLLVLVSFLYVSTLLNHKNDLSNNAERKQALLQEQNKQQHNAKLKQEITDAVYKKIYDSLNANKKLDNANLNNANELTILNKKTASELDHVKLGHQSNIVNSKNIIKAVRQQQSNLLSIRRAIKTSSSVKTNEVISNQTSKELAINSKTFQIPSKQNFQSREEKSLESSNKNPANNINTSSDKIDSETTYATRKESLTKPIKTIVVDSLKKTTVANPKKLASVFNKYFYVGALYAFDNTFEKNEKKNNENGESFGISLLLGYKISPKISLETGISFQNKEYYTSGNYFNKSILGANGSVDGIEAENSFIEIPLTLKYDWLNKKQHNIFTGIGVSSYLVNREKYEFEEDVAGTINNKSVEFTTLTSTMFATCNFSLGYQFNFQKLGSIRIQPYLNIPLKGLGKSQEYLVSRGINVGWIYNFNKR